MHELSIFTGTNIRSKIHLAKFKTATIPPSLSLFRIVFIAKTRQKFRWELETLLDSRFEQGHVDLTAPSGHHHQEDPD